MRLRKLALKGLTTFKEEVSIDFEALGPGIIALAGANGSGKSTLLEAGYACLYGEFPGYPGSLYGLATGTDAKIEIGVANETANYRALVSIDAVHQRSEAYLFDEDGQPVTGGKVRDFYAAVEQRFGSAKMTLACALKSRRRRGSFLTASKSERKDLVCEALGMEHLQALSEAARAKAKAGELALERLRGQLAEAEGELQRLVGAGSTEDLRVERVRIEAVITTAQADLDAARTRYADLQTRHALAVEAEKQREAKAKEIVELHTEIATLKAKVEDSPVEHQRAEQRAGAAIAAAEVEAGKLPEYQAAAEQLSAAREARAAAQADLTTVEQALRTAREALLTKTKETGKAAGIRIKLAAAQRQAGLLGEVPCTGSDSQARWKLAGVVGATETNLAAACPLLADARTAKGAIAALEVELADIEALEAELPGYQQAVDEADAAVRGARQSLAEAQAEVERLEPLAARLPGAQAAQARVGELRQQLEEALASLAAREAEYRSQLETLVAKRETLVAELETMTTANPAVLKAELEACFLKGKALSGQVDQFRAELQKLVQVIARAEAEAQRRVELEGRARAAREQLAGLEADLGDWVTLERALGRDGIQALLIDAAGPELSSLTNELLASCFGPRFSVRFITQAPKASEKGAVKEVFDVSVVDNDRGREAAADRYSGAEETILDEAISLALAIYVSRHSGHSYKTIFRDEATGLLDQENARRYLAMLRRARVLAGAEQIVLVAQQPEVFEAADVVLWVQDGKVEVRAS
jgi:exonuclease SbcC